MNFSNRSSLLNNKIKLCSIKCRQFIILKNIYAGFLVCLVFISSVLCDTDWTTPLTYEHIYNTTKYAQLESARGQRPAPPATRDRTQMLNNKEEFKFGDKFDINQKNQLLVGFSHDPFRLSIPQAEYLKGVRSMDPTQYSRAGDRDKRGAVHLYNMLGCATGCDPIAYKGYGCYCGFLGEGRPTDGIDNCCRLHDECYENFDCPFYTVYFQPYYWKCYHGEPLCALENHLSRHRLVNACAARLCDCDRRFATCVRRYACPRARPLCRSSPLRLLQNILLAK